MTLDRPVHAPETADGTTAPAVALHVALGSAAHGDLEQTLNPSPFSPPPDSWPRLAGGKS